MVMKGAKNTHYLQIDNKIEKICQLEGVEILPAELAWKKYEWTRKYFSLKPQKGYFIWVKEQTKNPLLSCVSISSPRVKQRMQNLLVVEENLKVDIRGTCNSSKKDLSGLHQATGKIVIKQGAKVNYQHIHSWGEKDIVETNYQFFLEKDSQLNYNYRVITPPRELKTNNRLILQENASANLEMSASCMETKFNIKESLILKGRNSSGMLKLRLAVGKNSRISADSQIRAEAEAKGHLDCQGLLTDEKAVISMVPALVCSHQKAQITHEASIGRVSEEQLNYLMMRGLTEKQALDLIINGFLDHE